MQSYQELIEIVLTRGRLRTDRTGTGTTGTFGVSWEHDMAFGFPLLTTKKMHWDSIITELVFFLKGRSDNQWLNSRGCTIWDEWQGEDGDLGPIYGAQWNKPDDRGFSQLGYIEWALRNKPECRRMVCSAWNWQDIDRMALPPCHMLWQCHTEYGRLNLRVDQRSADLFLGVPFNIASYGALLVALATCHGYEPGRLRFEFGDLHIYNDHLTQVEEQLRRAPMGLPELHCRKAESVRHLEIEDFTLSGYQSHPRIAGKVSV